MYFIDALNLIKTCVDCGLLHTDETNHFVYVMRETGWCLEQFDLVAHELMRDKDGQEVLMTALKEKGIEFIPKFALKE